jgi:hypothetical protein
MQLKRPQITSKNKKEIEKKREVQKGKRKSERKKNRDGK